MEACVDLPTESWLLPEIASIDRLAAHDWQTYRPTLVRDRAAMMDQAAALYAARRREIEGAHLAGHTGATVVAELTAAADRLLQALFGFVAAAHQPTGCPAFALIAVGGYGRGELNPYSDLDLLFVSAKRLTEKMRAIASDLLLVLWDMKLDVGHSVRTFRECISQAVADETVRTALIECRFLAGDPAIYDDFVKEVTRKVVDHQPRRYIEAKLAQHFTRLQQQGGSIFVREPHVKEGVGGLRDIHFATWVGKTRYRAQSFDELMKIGSISRQEREFLASARSFLWRVRNHLHFRAGRKSDVLSFDQQVGLAEHLGYEDREGFPASVSFMRYFYCHAQQIHFLSDVLLRRFAHDFGIGARLRTRLGMRTVGDGFVLHKDWVGVPLAAQGRFRERPTRLLELFELSATHRVPISHDTLSKISLELPDIEDAEVRSVENLAALRRLFTAEGPVGYWLRSMYQTGLFRRLVPEFARIQALCQPGPYHRYTVDEHTLRVVDYLDQIRFRPQEQHALFHETFRRLARPYLVYLGGLFHDLGKGYSGDHSDVGARLASAVMKRLGYPKDDIKIVQRLVLFHLLMPHYSQRLEIHDQRVLHTFVDQVIDEESLDLLLVLTYADAHATHPDMWSAWKEALVLELYGLAREQLLGREADTLAALRAAKIRELGEAAAEKQMSALLSDYLSEISDEELLGKTVAQTLADLEMLQRLDREPLQFRLVNPRGRPFSQLTVCTHDIDQPGLFSRITGVLVAHSLDIKAAQIRTRNGVVLDTLQLTTGDGERLTQKGVKTRLLEDLRAVLEGRARVSDLVKARERSSYVNPHVRHMDAHVTVDTRVASSATVLFLNAEDRPGLLHDVVTALANLRLYIRGAKIDTQAERVVDSFFVTDIFGHKVTDEGRLRYICRTLERAADHRE